jgi:hypothetical protein
MAADVKRYAPERAVGGTTRRPPAQGKSVNSMYLMLKIIIVHILLDSLSLLCYKIASNAAHDRARQQA